jgi:two-component system, OmpR family, catabolic regulation response regulator CreB
MPPRVILLVEDEPDIAFVVRLCLDPGRFALACAGTLAEARDLLARGPRPDLVVLDLGLPDGDGLTLCREVKAAHPGLPVMVLTAYTDDDARRLAREAGADRFVEKPFDPDDLRATVDELLGRRRASA